MAMIDNPTLQDLAKSFGISAETLGDLLVFYPVTDAGLNMDVPLPPDIAELNRRDDRGEDLTDEERDKLKNGIYIAGAYVINNYLDTIEANPEKYRPEIQKVIDELTKDRHEGETLDECIHGVLSKYGLEFTITPTGQKRQKQELTPEAKNLLFNDSVPLLNAELTNVLCELSFKNFKIDERANTATCKITDDMTVRIEGLGAFTGLRPSPLKLWDAIVSYFTYNNVSKQSDNIQTTVEIPLTEYAKVRGVDLYIHNYPDPEKQRREQKKRAKNKYEFKQGVEQDLNDLSKFRISGRINKGGAKGDYQNLVLIYPDHGEIHDIIRVKIPDDTARYLLNSNYITPYDPELQQLDERNPNLYRIARKLSLQSGNYQNQKAGTANSLKVSTLIDSTPHIPDLDTLERRGSTNWKEKIKKPLEIALNRLKKTGFLVSWTYRDPRAKKKYTPAEAGHLTAIAYINLTIVFELKKSEKKISPKVGIDDTLR